MPLKLCDKRGRVALGVLESFAPESFFRFRNLIPHDTIKKYEPDNVKQLVQEIILKQNPKFKNIFENEIKTWPLYSTPKIIPSSNKKVFYIGDAFNGFLPTLAQGAGQSIESAFEIFTLVQSSVSKSE